MIFYYMSQQRTDRPCKIKNFGVEFKIKGQNKLIFLHKILQSCYKYGVHFMEGNF